jgi:heme/copper-type cytochrome/quinol oxidase subunit 2
VWAWLLTIPAAAIMAAVTYAITVSPFALIALVLAVATAASAVVVAGRRSARRAPEPAPESGGAVEPAER